jgi:hypothetical protein
MKLSEIKTKLTELNSVDFELQNGTKVPEHFHVTEVGVVQKHFIDCGGTVRNEKIANFQLWNANDTDHRLKPQKLLNIIELSEKTLGIEDLEVEVEYQMETIGKYALEFNGKSFVLMPKFTDCLASDSCGIPQEKKKVRLSEIVVNNNSCCSPDSNCC